VLDERRKRLRKIYNNIKKIEGIAQLLIKAFTVEISHFLSLFLFFM